MALLPLVVKQLEKAIANKIFSVLRTYFTILKENTTQFIFLLQILQGSYIKQERFLLSILIFLHTGCSQSALRMRLLRSLKEKFSVVLLTAVATSLPGLMDSGFLSILSTYGDTLLTFSHMAEISSFNPYICH